MARTRSPRSAMNGMPPSKPRRSTQGTCSPTEGGETGPGPPASREGRHLARPRARLWRGVWPRPFGGLGDGELVRFVERGIGSDGDIRHDARPFPVRLRDGIDRAAPRHAHAEAALEIVTRDRMRTATGGLADDRRAALR